MPRFMGFVRMEEGIGVPPHWLFDPKDVSHGGPPAHRRVCPRGGALPSHRGWTGVRRGPGPLPGWFAAHGESGASLNPGWEVRLWTEETIPEDLRRPEVRERLRVPAERSDILRLEILWRHGGVYVDTDFECIRPLEPLVGGLDFFCAYLKPGQANNAFIGATSGHPILDRALDELRPNEWHGYDKAAAGPGFLSHLH